MAIQQLNTIDKDADLMQRVRQSADLMRADPNMLNYYGQMRKERRAKEAANTAYQNLAAKSKGKIEFRNDPGNELGSPLIKFDENVRTGATDYSRDPKTEAMLSVESGDNRYRTHIDNDRQIVEDGSLAPVQEHMKGLMGNIVPGAIAAPPAQSSLAPSYNQPPVAAAPPSSNPALTTGLPLERLAQATQSIFPDMKLGAIPANGGSASKNFSSNESVNSSYNSGQATPVTMKAQYSQAGFADMNPDVQGMYVDKEAADINNMVLKAHGLDAIDNINDQKLKDATERFRALNQSLNPNFSADIQGGSFGGPAYSKGHSRGFSIGTSKGSGGQQADQSSFTASDISGAGERPGTLITKHNANTGVSIVRPTANGKATQIPAKTIQGVLSGRITDTDFNKAEQDELKRLMKDGSIDKDGYVRKQIPLTSPVTAKLFEKLQTEHDRSLRVKQEQISASEESAKKTSETIRNR